MTIDPVSARKTARRFAGGIWYTPSKTRMRGGKSETAA